MREDDESLPQRIAIFGGTFNPIHWGHLLIAETALDQMNLDQVLWVPSRLPPHKASSTLAAFHHRICLIQQAIADHHAFQLSTIEVNRTGPAYAIDTFTDLQTLYSESQWYWIVGEDTFQSLPRWYRSQDLMGACEWLVAPRQFSDPRHSNTITDPSPQLQYRWQRLQMPYLEISSSLIRQYCREQRSIRYLVPEPVRQYIQAQKLYQV